MWGSTVRRKRRKETEGDLKGGGCEPGGRRERDCGHRKCGRFRNCIRAGAADTGSALKKSIIKGMSQAASDAARLALKDTDALELINTDMIPALDEVGKDSRPERCSFRSF